MYPLEVYHPDGVDDDDVDDDGQTHCYAVTGEEDWHSICPAPAPL